MRIEVWPEYAEVPNFLDDADLETLREMFDWADTGMSEMEVGEAERVENKALMARAVAVLSKITGGVEQTPSERWTAAALEAHKRQHP